MLILKVFKYQKIIENKILKNVILKISKNVACAYGYKLVCVCKLNLVSFSSLT